MTAHSRRRELYSESLAWYAQASDAAFGHRSGHGSLIAQLERGTVGGSGGVPDSDIYDDSVIGWGNCPVGAVERVRRIEAVLQRVDRKHLHVLTVHYGAIPSTLREPDGAAAPMTFLDLSLAAVTVAMMTERELARFVWCCQKGKTSQREATRNQLVKKHQRAAEDAVREAHRAYYAAEVAKAKEVDCEEVATA